MRPFLAALALALAAAAGSACKPAEQPRPSGAHLRKPLVTAALLEPRDVEYVVEAPGSVEASEEIAVPAAVSGIVDAVNFKEGDVVGPGTILVEIEPERFRLGEERAAADLERARAQAELAETLYTNRVKLAEEGKKANKEFVTSEQLATWKADLEKAKADVARARADLELAKRDHRNSRVRPPIQGVINAKLVSRGEFVKAETVITRILNVSTLHLVFTVPELEAARLAPGQEIRFAIRSAPGQEFKAKLFHLSQKADPVTRSVTGKAEILDRSEALRAGTFAQAKMTTRRLQGLVVPERAVLPTERGFVVFVLEGITARARTVKLGLRLDGVVEVVEGLSRGDRIVVDGALTLRDGLEIEVAGPKPEKAAEKPGEAKP
jgi:multidrug efflux system membrane fusion protein